MNGINVTLLIDVRGRCHFGNVDYRKTKLLRYLVIDAGSSRTSVDERQASFGRSGIEVPWAERTTPSRSLRARTRINIG